MNVPESSSWYGMSLVISRSQPRSSSFFGAGSGRSVAHRHAALGHDNLLATGDELAESRFRLGNADRALAHVRLLVTIEMVIRYGEAADLSVVLELVQQGAVDGLLPRRAPLLRP